MMYTFFVLDYDGTYDNEFDEYDSLGVCPSVYAIDINRQLDVEKLAKKSHDLFHGQVYKYENQTIGDIFEELLRENKIDWLYVGRLEITFKDRQVDYLADYIPKVVV